MTKFIILALALLACWPAANAYNNFKKIGLKGEVDKVQYSSYNFIDIDSDGDLSTLVLENPNEGLMHLTSVEETSTGFTGYWNGGKVTVTTGGNRITKAVYGHDGAYYVLTYYYNDSGFVSSVKLVKNWTEETEVYHPGKVSVNTHNYETYIKKAQAALKRYDMVNYYKYYNLATQAALNTTTSVTEGRTTIKKENRSQEYETSYYNYEVDDFGNWISRVRDNYGKQERTIVYDADFASQHLWYKTVSCSDNLVEIEKFINDASTTSIYKQMATDRWNNLAMNYARAIDVDVVTIEYASNPIMTEDNREALLAPVRERIYQNRAMATRDFGKVQELLNEYSEPVIDNDLRSRITQRYEYLKQDSLHHMEEAAQMEFDKGNIASYQRAADIAYRAYQIDKSNPLWAKVWNDSHYNTLKIKEYRNMVTDSDYTDFLDKCPSSSYVQEVKNSRTELALSRLGKDPSLKTLNEIVGYGADGKTYAKAIKARDKQYKKLIYQDEVKRRGGGSFFMGGSIGYSNDGCQSYFTYGLDARFGHSLNKFNLHIGAVIQQIRVSHWYSSGYPEGTEMIKDNGVWKDAKVDTAAVARLEVNRLSMPIDLRFNIGRGAAGNAYVFAGVALNYAFKSNYRTGTYSESQWHKDNKVATAFTVTPRFGIGFHMHILELELFSAYESMKIYDEDYVKQLDIVPPYSQENILNDQMKRKWRFGFDFRLLIGKMPTDF